MNAINPQHYQQHPSGVECIAVTRRQVTTVGTCIKYLWRAGLKGDRLEDLQKARQCLAWAVADDARVRRGMAIDRWMTWYFRGDPRPEDHTIYSILLGNLDVALMDLDGLIEAASHD